MSILDRFSLDGRVALVTAGAGIILYIAMGLIMPVAGQDGEVESGDEWEEEATGDEVAEPSQPARTHRRRGPRGSS